MPIASARLIHADAILPGDQPAIVDGAVVVDATDTVLDVGPAGELCARHAGARVERITGAMGPGLVNAHTHLELSALRGRVPGGMGFVPWAEQLVALRASQRTDDDVEAIEAAVLEVDQAGTAAVGDVSNRLAAVHALTHRGIGGIVFHELFGMDPERASKDVAVIQAALEAALSRSKAAHADGMSEVAAADLQHAPAPHTLYTTHPDVVRAFLSLARALGTRTSIHLAEHSAERAFLETGGGPFAAFARRTRLYSPRFAIPHKGPVELAADLGLLAADVILVHLTDALPSEIAQIAERGAHVVLCPRSNLHIEAKLPPLLEWLRVGLVPALGTDSLASNASLDVLAEAQTLGRHFPSVSPLVLFEMATAAGARALGRADLGRIAKGTRPGLLAFEGNITGDPCAWAIAQSPERRRWLVRRNQRP